MIFDGKTLLGRAHPSVPWRAVTARALPLPRAAGRDRLADAQDHAGQPPPAPRSPPAAVDRGFIPFSRRKQRDGAPGRCRQTVFRARRGRVAAELAAGPSAGALQCKETLEHMGTSGAF